MTSRSLVLVTGANGFIGQALVQSLVASGVPVRAAVRHPERAADAWEVAAVGDIDGQTPWGAALQGVDTVVHLAARAHVHKEVAADPLNAFRQVNVDGTLNLARQAVKAGVRRLVFVSSIGVNGAKTNEVPFTADDEPMPHSAYSVSKHEAEQGLRQLAQETGLEVVIVRPPLVYGPRAPGNFGALVRAVARGWPLPLGAVTDNRRSLVAIDNLIGLIVTCLTHAAAANQTFLVSDGRDVSTVELLRRLGATIGKPARLLPVPVGLLSCGANWLGKPEVFQSLCGSLQVDIHKTQQLLGWSPSITFDEGLKRAVKGMQSDTRF